MKKFTSILAAATFVVALSSCGSKPAETTEATADSTAMAAPAAAADSSAMAAPAADSAAMGAKADTTKK